MHLDTANINQEKTKMIILSKIDYILDNISNLKKDEIIDKLYMIKDNVLKYISH